MPLNISEQKRKYLRKELTNYVKNRGVLRNDDVLLLRELIDSLPLGDSATEHSIPLWTPPAEVKPATMNLNQQVWVQLNEPGRRTLRDYARALDDRMPQSFRERNQSVMDMFPTTHGYTRIQLHDLSTVFPGSRLDAYMDMNILLNEPTGPTKRRSHEQL